MCSFVGDVNDVINSEEIECIGFGLVLFGGGDVGVRDLLFFVFPSRYLIYLDLTSEIFLVFGLVDVGVILIDGGEGFDLGFSDEVDGGIPQNRVRHSN